MKTLSKLLLLLITLLYQQVGHTQNGSLQGIATYKTAATINLGGDSTISHSEQAMMQAQVRKLLQQEYTLSFNGEESNYKQVEKLNNNNTAQSGGMMVRVANSSSLVYKNTKKKRYVEDANLFGKPFLIDDKLEVPAWTMTGKTKQIGKYECQQAIYYRESRITELDTQSGEAKEVVSQVEVLAWFTTEIPVNHGPSEFWGLPGLILEVNNGNATIICSDVVLNPQAPVQIKIPKGGKTITRAKYTQMREEKMKEIQLQYNGSGPQRRMIRVGG